MRKTVIFGFVLVCITGASFLGVTPVERKILNPGSTTISAPTKATQVEVRNLTTAEAVVGTVKEGNLPLNEGASQGNAGPFTVVLRQVRFIGLTDTRMTPLSTVLDMSNQCATELPGTRMCFLDEVFRTIPPPHELPNSMWVFSIGSGVGNVCAGRGGGPFACFLGASLPVACCGF